jgi:YbbR domain-containing protein
MHSIGSHKEVTVDVPVKYINTPANIQFSSPLPKNISVTIKEENFSLINYIFINKIDTLEVDLDRLNANIKNGSKALTLDTMLRHLITNKFRNSTKIINYEPKRIALDYITLKSKTLPILLSDSIMARRGYVVSDSIRIRPKYITVFGKDKIIDTLKSVKIEPLMLDSLKETVILTKKIVEIQGVTTSKKEVEVSIPVDRAIEKSIEIPVSCINAPNGLVMKSFPSKVTVKFIISMGKFNKISPSDFTVTADYSQRISSNICTLTLTQKPLNISSIIIEPKEIEFSLEQ